MSQIQNRIKEYIDNKDISVREFCRKIGVSPSFLSRDAEIASDKLLNIVNAFPEISIDWLVTGKGKMIRGELDPLEGNKDENDILKELLEGCNNQIDELKKLLKDKDKQVSDLIKTNLYLLEREKEGGHSMPESAKESRSAG